jgi:DNA-directed RNA polymerase subunit RPC12/RpoP
MTPELNCSKCGGNRFRYPPSIHDETPIRCEDCGHTVGTFSQLKEKMTAQVLRGKNPRVDDAGQTPV